MQDFMVIDIETRDPNLSDMGPGVYRNDGYILGVGICAPFLKLRKYYNLGHPDCSDGERQHNVDILRKLFEMNCTKVFTNALYDLAWLINGKYAFKINGKWEDIITREALLNAYEISYSLDSLSKKYGREGKREDKIQQICYEHNWKGAPQTHLWKMNACDIDEYMAGDTEEPAYIFMLQQGALEAENLIQVNDVECGLLPCLIQMQKVGFRVDEKRRLEVKDMLEKEYKTKLFEFSEKYNCLPNFNSSQQVAKLFERLGIPVAQTEKGNPKVGYEELLACPNEIGKEIIDIKGYKTVINNFIDGSLKNFQVDGRIHCVFYPSKKDDGGTVTGRFSCNHPNLQQIPAKKEKHGDEIRSILIPEDDCWYGAPDFKQIEYRVLAHFAMGPGSEEIRAKYRSNPKTDYHQYVVDLTGLDRKHAKNFNFGCVYCMGIPTMSRKFAIPIDRCRELSEQYFAKMPFIKPTRDNIMRVAKMRGYVKTILGRRARVSEDMKAAGRIYPIVNYLIQGTAADIMKKGMLDCFRAGLFDICKCHITVHDELGLSVPKTLEGIQAYHEIMRIMENTIKLDVPLYVDRDMGNNWGDVGEENYEAFCKEVGYVNV